MYLTESTGRSREQITQANLNDFSPISLPRPSQPTPAPSPQPPSALAPLGLGTTPTREAGDGAAVSEDHEVVLRGESDRTEGLLFEFG